MLRVLLYFLLILEHISDTVYGIYGINISHEVTNNTPYNANVQLIDTYFIHTYTPIKTLNTEDRINLIRKLLLSDCWAYALA